MSEERLCPHCGKKLRSDNTKGMCAKCQARGRTLDGVYGLDKPASKPAPAEKAEQLDVDATMVKFRSVVRALGLDESVILAQAAQGWLEGLRDILDGKDIEG